MKIRTQFIITMFLFGIILALMGVSAIITNLRIQKASEQEKIASSIAQGAGELSYLANDYLIYRENQQLKRWRSRFASFSSQVAGLRPDRLDQQALVANIRANQKRLKEVFDSVASASVSRSRNPSAALDPASYQVSWSRTAVQSQGLVSDASRLSRLLDQEMDQLIHRRTMLLYLMVGLFGLFLLASYMLTYRRILKSLAALQAGTAVIGSGHLDFIIEEKKNDEIGDLSRAFNRMATDLKAVTASKADLEREITQRKQAEEDLRRQREWLRVTLSSIGDAVIASDTQGRITFLNSVAVTLTGWQAEDAMGQPIQSVFRIIDEKTHIPAEDLVARVLDERRVVGLANDTALVTKDGREVPIEDSAAPIEDSAGNLIGVVLVFHDVTEKRRAKEGLRESEERYRTMADFTYDWEYWRSPDKRFYYMSPSCERITGYAREEFIRDPDVYSRIIHLDDRERVVAHLHEDRSREELCELEFRIVRRDGQERWIGHACRPVVDAQGKSLGRRASDRDITERKLAEQALRESQADLNRAQAVARTGSWRLDVKRNELLWSDETYRMFSIPKGTALTYETFLSTVHPDDRPYVDQKWRAALRREPYDIEHRIVVGDTLKWVRERAELEFDKDGSLLGGFGTVQDITERKRAEEVLRQRTLELQQLNQTLEQRVQERTAELEKANEALRYLSSRFLSAQEDERKRIALEIHDSLGASLAAVKFKIEEVLQRAKGRSIAGSVTETLRTTIPLIQESADECRRIQMDLRPAMLDDLGLLPTISWFSRRFQTIYSGIRIEQELRIEEENVPDSLKIVIFRVLQEAMNNIGKHSRADLVHLALEEKGDHMELTVRDNGVGFDVEEVVRRSTSKRGLGLTSLRERTELSGGAFSIHSAKGKGTTIHASWPTGKSAN